MKVLTKTAISLAHRGIANKIGFVANAHPQRGAVENSILNGVTQPISHWPVYDIMHNIKKEWIY